jgi:hypothetical protein
VLGSIAVPERDGGRLDTVLARLHSPE